MMHHVFFTVDTFAVPVLYSSSLVQFVVTFFIVFVFRFVRFLCLLVLFSSLSSSYSILETIRYDVRMAMIAGAAALSIESVST